MPGDCHYGGERSASVVSRPTGSLSQEPLGTGLIAIRMADVGEQSLRLEDVIRFAASVPLGAEIRNFTCNLSVTSVNDSMTMSAPTPE